LFGWLVNISLGPEESKDIFTLDQIGNMGGIKDGLYLLTRWEINLYGLNEDGIVILEERKKYCLIKRFKEIDLL
jgi:hypothetical protein